MPIAIIADDSALDKNCSQQLSSSSSHSEANSIGAQRESDGRCGDCGLQTHQVRVDPLTKSQVKIPLTVEGEVHRGRCLFCHPLTNQQQLFHHQMACLSETSSTRWSCSNSPSSPTRRVSQLQPLLPLQQQQQQPSQTYHNPSTSVVQKCLSVIQGYHFDICDILMAMSHVPHDMLIQEKGCERLWILSWEEENSAAIGRTGGITVILNAMARFPMNAHLQQCGCESLQNLALNEYNRREICDLGGVQLTVQAMARHATVPGIQQCGCTALASIASSTMYAKTHRRIIENSGGLQAILAAAKNFCDEESIVEAAHDAITVMGYDLNGRVTPAVEEIQEQPDSDRIVCMES